MSTTIERAPRLLPGSTANGTGSTAFVRRHAVGTYFALTFLISWVGVFLVVAFGPGRFPVTMEEFQPYIPYWGLAMVAGPTLSGLLLTGLAGGKAAIRGLLSRLSQWRTGARWYAVALLAAPLAIVAVLVPLSLVSTDFLPAIVTTDDPSGLLLVGIAAGLTAGVFEELGWTGFAVPRLRLRYGTLASGLLLGGVWGLWHILPYAAENGTPAGTLALHVFLPNVLFFLAVLSSFRILMVWVYDRTESLLLAMLMHASLSATAPFILAPDVTGAALAGFYLALSAVLWTVVAALGIRNRSQREGRRLDPAPATNRRVEAYDRS